MDPTIFPGYRASQSVPHLGLGGEPQLSPQSHYSVHLGNCHVVIMTQHPSDGTQGQQADRLPREAVGGLCPPKALWA